MRLNQAKVQELAERYVGGQKNDVRNAVKNLTQLEFYFLVNEIVDIDTGLDKDIYARETAALLLAGNF